jgi:hypothetical protein
MGKENGTYTENMAAVRELLARLDERQQDIRADILEIKMGVAANRNHNAEQDERLAVLGTRQKVIGGSLVAVGGGLVSLVVDWLFR